MKMKAKIGAMQLQVKEHQRWLRATKQLGTGKEGPSPRAFRGSMALPAP